MRRRTRKNKNLTKIGFTFTILILSLASISASYAAWYDTIEINGTVTTGEWGGCIRIKKTLDYCCPHKCGVDTEDFGGDKATTLCDGEEKCCFDYYKLTIIVENNGSTDLTDVEVFDSVGPRVTPLTWTIQCSYDTFVSWTTEDVAEGTFYHFKWIIGDLDKSEIVTLSMCIKVCCSCGDYQSAYIHSPQDGVKVDIPRITHTPSGDVPGFGEYITEHFLNHRIIKFDGIDPLLGEDKTFETDTFTFEVSGGSDIVKVKTKASTNEAITKLQGVGDSHTDPLHFQLTLKSITPLPNGNDEYVITVKSLPPGKCHFHALSHIVFDFGKYCVKDINQGATVTANGPMGCIGQQLTNTTESITLQYNQNGDLIYPSSLPYSTPWAWDCR